MLLVVDARGVEGLRRNGYQQFDRRELPTIAGARVVTEGVPADLFNVVSFQDAVEWRPSASYLNQRISVYLPFGALDLGPKVCPLSLSQNSVRERCAVQTGYIGNRKTGHMGNTLGEDGSDPIRRNVLPWKETSLENEQVRFNEGCQAG